MSEILSLRCLNLLCGFLELSLQLHLRGGQFVLQRNILLRFPELVLKLFSHLAIIKRAEMTDDLPGVAFLKHLNGFPVRLGKTCSTISFIRAIKGSISTTGI